MAQNLEGETIVAIATPPGTGGIGIIRISGAASTDILSRIFRKAKKEKTEPNKATVGWVVDNNGDKVDKAIVLYMKAPNSYTGEDVIEISCHGSPKLLKEILDLSIKAGARQASKGEFTKRALLNGKIDLTQAEAVIDIIGARTSEALRSAARQLDGGISKEIHILKDSIMETLAQIEASIDFPDEVSEVSKEKHEKSILGTINKIDKLITTAEYGRLYREGLLAAIIGRPNVGKSSIMNALLREERAIVTDIPGTTRDTLEESMNIRGIQVNIIDTAGLRKTNDLIEKLGVERAERAAAKADILITVIDASEDLTSEDISMIEAAKDKPKIIVFNKVDLGIKASEKKTEEVLGKRAVIVKTCAIKGKGIKELEKTIHKEATKGMAESDRNIYINSRHKECLIRAKGSLYKCLESVKNDMASDFLAIDLKAAVSALGEITGEEVSEEVVDAIFERFCVGK